ncbi:hypothetical protein [uncultured Tateyamaria sp.]|uniref:hypothetical protein n=1 Tax=Tateyamaria sp. 1078 TaxID=3417464 RepID=UPI0026070A7B|nr:hypothetical protein [uncultured Tateyamaria sp.]
MPRYLTLMRGALVLFLAGLIVVAHIFLWRSDMAFGLKLTFTILNAMGWSIVLLPILFIDKWLAAIKRRNAETDNHDNVT